VGETSNAGTIEVGKRADFVLVEDNPLAYIEHATSVKGVFSHGHWYSKNRDSESSGRIETALVVAGRVAGEMKPVQAK
jgi:hypothetical protein